MLPKKRTNGSETGRQRREEKELTGAEYELPPEGCPRNLFCSLTQSPAVFKKAKESSVHKIFTFFPAFVLTFEDRRRLVFLL